MALENLKALSNAQQAVYDAVDDTTPRTINDLMEALSTTKWTVYPIIRQLLERGLIIQHPFRVDRQVAYTKLAITKTPSFMIHGRNTRPVTMWDIVKGGDTPDLIKPAETINLLPNIFLNLYLYASEIDQGTENNDTWNAIRKDLLLLQRTLKTWLQVVEEVRVHPMMETKSSLAEFLLNDKDNPITRKELQELAREYRKPKAPKAEPASVIDIS